MCKNVGKPHLADSSHCPWCLAGRPLLNPWRLTNPRPPIQIKRPPCSSYQTKNNTPHQHSHE